MSMKNLKKRNIFNSVCMYTTYIVLVPLDRTLLNGFATF